MKRRTIIKIAIALTIAGSDSGGGAGIQADLKTFHACGVFGTCAITCVTAQNPNRVSAVQPLPPWLVVKQMDRIFEVFPVGAVKTGMLYDAKIIRAVARDMARRKSLKLVIDPVMVATSGATLLRKDAIHVLLAQLFPQATVVTPNVMEAEVLLRTSIQTLDDQQTAAHSLTKRFGVPFLVKGGHLRQGKQSVDVLFDGKRFYKYRATRMLKTETHGTGCVFSAALTANLALGYDLPKSVSLAKRFVTRAIRNAVKVGKVTALWA